MFFRIINDAVAIAGYAKRNAFESVIHAPPMAMMWATNIDPIVKAIQDQQDIIAVQEERILQLTRMLDEKAQENDGLGTELRALRGQTELNTIMLQELSSLIHAQSNR